MKKLMRIILLFPLFLMMTMTAVQAEENDDDNTETADITLTYKMEGVIFHQLHITVSGPGIVRDGEAVIREGTNTYEMREDAEKILEIEADEGSHIVSIKVNGAEKDIAQNRVTLKELKEETEVSIIFEKDGEKPADQTNPTDPVEPEDPNNGQNKPNGDQNGTGNQNKPNNGGNVLSPGTGDVTRTGIFIILMSVSSGTIIYVRRRKEKTKMSEGEK